MRMQLHRDPNVVFAGYQVPHPSDNRIVVKVRAGSSRRARSLSPRRAHRDASPPGGFVPSPPSVSFLGFPPSRLASINDD